MGTFTAKLAPVLLEEDERASLSIEEIHLIIHCNMNVLARRTFVNHTMAPFIHDHVLPYIEMMVQRNGGATLVSNFVRGCQGGRMYASDSFRSILEALGEELAYNDTKTISAYIVSSLLKLCRTEESGRLISIDISGEISPATYQLVWHISVATEGREDTAVIKFNQRPPMEW